ncbi:hypothetical protein D3C87_1934490 [compost metagenome]
MAQTTEVVAEPETAKMILYPNPVADVLYLTKSTQTVEKVLIYNMSGTLVSSTGKDAESIDLSNLIQGTYLVKVYTNDGSFNQTILKK